jgi:hypothetical protein
MSSISGKIVSAHSRQKIPENFAPTLKYRLPIAQMEDLHQPDIKKNRYKNWRILDKNRARNGANAGLN